MLRQFYSNLLEHEENVIMAAYGNVRCGLRPNTRLQTMQEKRAIKYSQQRYI